MLNLIDFVALVFTAILTVAGLVGFTRFQDFQKDTAARMDELEQKRKVIEDLQKEMQDKINAVGELRKYVELQEFVTKSVEDTNKALLYLILGNQLVEQKKIAKAIEAYEKVKVLRPEDPQVNYTLGRTYLGISSYDQAITCLTTSVEMEPSFAQAHLELGLAYRNRADKLYSAPDDEMRRDEEYEKAIDQIKQAAKLQPGDEDILGTLGGFYRRAKDYKRALMYYKQVRDVNPDLSYAIGNIAILAWHEGNRASSLEAFKQTDELATKRIDFGLSYDPFGTTMIVAWRDWCWGTKWLHCLIIERQLILRAVQNISSQSLMVFRFFKEVEDKYPLDGLDEVLSMVTEASLEAEARMVAKHVGY